jgi:hypothetical protein
LGSDGTNGEDGGEEARYGWPNHRKTAIEEK